MEYKIGKKSKDIEATIHKKTKRKNIPTEELRDFVAEDEAKPKTIFYPRDPSLDPQLVWRGKDEQDAKDLAVPAVPIYIQEKIHPKYIIEDLRAQAKKEKPELQMQLFADFNGLKFEEMVEFYQHEQSWANRMILGDSLLVMTSLAEKEGLKGKVQMIYVDPPYGIKFGSNWQVSTRKRDVKDGSAGDTTRQPEQIKAFRDTWKLGIHSYLAYLRDRLVVARDLLSETGSIFVQIGDENLHLVRCLLDEVFGSENFVGQILFRKTGGLRKEGLASVGDYLLWYCKQNSQMKFRRLFKPKVPGMPGATQFKYRLDEEGGVIELSTSEMAATDSDGLISHDNLTSQGNPVYEYKFGNQIFRSNFKPPPRSMDRLVWAGRVIALGNTLRYVRKLSDFPYFELDELWNDLAISGFADEKIYVVQTTAETVQRCLMMTTDPGDLVLDPTCGSGTTAYVAEQWGRRWITIDTSRVALALARTRLMSARFPYYLLSDSQEGVKKEAELTGRTPPDYKTDGDIRKGFVYKRVPHVTLKSIANNPDIKEGMSRKEIDEAIARYTETETLYDQPYEDNKRLRVTGPFTVESLSPHRVIATDDRERAGLKPATTDGDDGSRFVQIILDNLKKAGVQNTVKNERLKFDRLEPYAGEWIHAEGEYTEKDGNTRKVAVCIGPEYGTVDAELVKDAAKEAVKGVGFDLLIVCGFAFDPHVSEEAKRYGKLTVLITRMNPDLAMGDELLKTTGAGNLFMVFGEPDVNIKKGKDGKVVVKINGVDVYDPTTGQIRSDSTDDIACWFIDTDYNEESFFVRHAYFTGAEEPYEKLKRALRAEIDEAAWSALYSTVSRPFDVPKTGKIAIKVINHYGDEVLKVFEVK
jgi:adenine-specific DNA-methyltransferase